MWPLVSRLRSALAATFRAETPPPGTSAIAPRREITAEIAPDTFGYQDRPEISYAIRSFGSLIRIASGEPDHQGKWRSVYKVKHLSGLDGCALRRDNHRPADAGQGHRIVRAWDQRDNPWIDHPLVGVNFANAGDNLILTRFVPGRSLGSAFESQRVALNTIVGKQSLADMARYANAEAFDAKCVQLQQLHERKSPGETQPQLAKLHEFQDAMERYAATLATLPQASYDQLIGLLRAGRPSHYAVNVLAPHVHLVLPEAGSTAVPRFGFVHCDRKDLLLMPQDVATLSQAFFALDRAELDDPNNVALITRLMGDRRDAFRRHVASISQKCQAAELRLPP